MITYVTEHYIKKTWPLIHRIVQERLGENGGINDPRYEGFENGGSVSMMIVCFTLNCGSVEYNYLCIYDCSICWNAFRILFAIFSYGTGKMEYLFHETSLINQVFVLFLVWNDCAMRMGNAILISEFP